jgi:hypothetical protein
MEAIYDFVEADTSELAAVGSTNFPERFIL